ncbi:MAG: acyltransferase family protein [Acidimicrobiales bacterium]|nr:acyltransferase family protein [Acidimicrobiales bacterium]
MRYRPEIDGVRALAVVAVVAYHAGVPGFGGGFVGVDVFFVISGFLITGLLVGEVERSGRLSVAGFYGRRARRLLPVAALVTVATVVVGWWVLSPIDRGDLTADALATSTYTINLRLAAQHYDYLRADLFPSAFQQFWSLAVEEQFYLVWPLVLWAALRGASARRRAAAVVGAVVGASFVVSLWWTAAAPEWAFFALPARAWQLGLGALLGLAWSRVERLDERGRAVGQLVGLAAIVASVVGLSSATAWPGWWALLPTVATLLVLAGPPSGPFAALLGQAPLTWVGVRSYSWYLWHWPTMVFAAAALDRDVGGWPAVLAGVGALALAHVTYTLVEQPVRRAPRLVASPRASVVLGLAVTVTLAGSFAVLHATRADVLGPGTSVADDGGAPTPLDPERLDAAALVEQVPANLTPALADARADLPVVFTDGCNGDLGPTTVDAARVEACTYGDADGDRTVVLVGDSHAAQWQPALAALAEDAGVRLVVLTKSACPVADLTVDNRLLGRPYTECDTWRDDVVALVGELEPDLVVVASSSRYDAPAPDGSGAEADAEDWTAALTRTLGAVAATAPTVFLGDTPYPAGDVPACLAEHLSDAPACALDRGQLAFDLARVEAQAASDAGVPLVPTVDLVCGLQRCPVIVGRHLVYRDASHLATPYVERLAPQVGALLDAAAPRAGASPLFGAG